MEEYDGITTVYPLGLAAVVVCAVCMLILPRRYVIWPMIALACFVPSTQRIVVFGADFDFLRIAVLFGMIRVFTTNLWRGFRWKALDFAILAWGISGTIIYTVLFQTFGALVFKLGASYDAVGMYFLFRMLIRDWADVQHVVKGQIIISVPVALFFAYDVLTGHNLFAIFGGVFREVTWVREGRLRCQGAFSHPILAGCFFAATLPLIVAQCWARVGRTWIVGVIAGLFLVYACGSATPIMSLVFAMMGAAAFFIRNRMRWVRRGIVVGAVILHLLMKAPVWHLLARMNVVDGSTGWHRFYLVDNAIHHFDEWWAIGLRSTAHWGFLMHDVTNQYVLEGVRGGVLTLALFVVLIAIAFRHVGLVCRSAEGDRGKQIQAWALGISLFVHVTNFVAISYFGQIAMLWYLSLAMIGSMDVLKRGEAREATLPPSARCAPRRLRRVAGAAGTRGGSVAIPMDFPCPQLSVES